MVPIDADFDGGSKGCQIIGDDCHLRFYSISLFFAAGIIIVVIVIIFVDWSPQPCDSIGRQTASFGADVDHVVAYNFVELIDIFSMMEGNKPFALVQFQWGLN